MSEILKAKLKREKYIENMFGIAKKAKPFVRDKTTRFFTGTSKT